MARTDVYVQDVSNANKSGAGTDYVVKTPTGVLYVVFIDAEGVVGFKKSTNGGASWSTKTTIASAVTHQQLSVWYDRWSDISAGLIHCAYVNSTTDGVTYRSIDTESSDTLSSEVFFFNGVSTALGGALSICRARGGNLGCIFNIDAGAEDGFYRSTDVGANWSVSGDPTEGASGDQYILMPGWAADNQDLMLFFWDADADEISRKLYDDSANTWSETSIATSMVDVLAGTTTYPHFSAAVDITNSRNLLAAWSGVDLLNADLRCWHVTESAITEVTNVVLDSTDDQGLCAIGIDTDTQDWYVFYGGKSDGTDTWASFLNVYYKVSTDDGATWGAETRLTPGFVGLSSLYASPCSAGFPIVAYSATMGVAIGLIVNAEPPAGGAAGRAILVNNENVVA